MFARTSISMRMIYIYNITGNCIYIHTALSLFYTACWNSTHFVGFMTLKTWQLVCPILNVNNDLTQFRMGLRVLNFKCKVSPFAFGMLFLISSVEIGIPEGKGGCLIAMRLRVKWFIFRTIPPLIIRLTGDDNVLKRLDSKSFKRLS